MPYFFSSLGSVLVEMPTSICDKKKGGRAVIVLVDGPPSEGIDGSWLFDTCVNLCDFVISSKVEDAYIAISVSTSSHSVFLIEPRDHHFAGLRNNSLHKYLVLERHFLDDSALRLESTCCRFVMICSACSV